MEEIKPKLTKRVMILNSKLFGETNGAMDLWHIFLARSQTNFKVLKCVHISIN